jgi:putative Ca2+/H+ antiporter (TMEM165/GDT1 family)
VNFAVAALTLALVIPAELPDKTFISCVVLSSRYRPFPVWVGAAVGLSLQAAIAVVAGGFLALLPHKAVQGVVAALFLGGAAYLLFVPEKVEEARGEEIADEEVLPAGPSTLRIIWSTFAVVALAEFGDITQVLIANLAAKYKDPVSVFAGAAVAFSLVAVAGVMGGAVLTRYVPLQLVRRISGLALLGFAVYTLVQLLTG